MTAKQTIDTIFAAFGRGDIPGILSHVAPDCLWRQPKSLPWGGDHRGPEGVQTFFSRLNETTETVLWEVNEVFESGENVFAFGRHGGKSRKTGKTSISEWAFRFKVRNGKVVHYTGYPDTADILAALN